LYSISILETSENQYLKRGSVAIGIIVILYAMERAYNLKGCSNLLPIDGWRREY
jgi:hypothetical protein